MPTWRGAVVKCPGHGTVLCVVCCSLVLSTVVGRRPFRPTKLLARPRSSPAYSLTPPVRLRSHQGRRRGPNRGHMRHTNSAPRYTDRKSTRLNSSHLGISYAVFCLKKKQHS